MKNTTRTRRNGRPTINPASRAPRGDIEALLEELIQLYRERLRVQDTLPELPPEAELVGPAPEPRRRARRRMGRSWAMRVATGRSGKHARRPALWM